MAATDTGSIRDGISVVLTKGPADPDEDDPDAARGEPLPDE